jgi:hypothetical protein
MSKVGIKLKIDVTKIDKALLFKGKKGVYLDATVFVELHQADEYGNNGMITQEETKENREAGKNGPILGNCKLFWTESGRPAAPQQHSNHAPKGQTVPARYDDFDDDIPF